MPRSTKASSSTSTTTKRRERNTAVAKHVERRGRTVQPFQPQRPSQVAKRRPETYSRNQVIVAVILTASVMLNAAMVVAWIAG